MINESKILLKISIVLYIIVGILSILSYADISFLKDVTKFSDLYIPITGIILFAYVWDKGDDNIAKIGLGCICVSLIINIISHLGLFSAFDEKSINTYKALITVNSVASSGSSLMQMIALFSIIPSTSSTGGKLKLVAILSYVIATILSFIVLKKLSNTLMLFHSLFSNLARFGEYGFIVYYLLNKPKPSDRVVLPPVEATVAPTNQPITNQSIPQTASQQVIPQQTVQQPVQQAIPQPIQQTMSQQVVPVQTQVIQQPVQQTQPMQPPMQS